MSIYGRLKFPRILLLATTIVDYCLTGLIIRIFRHIRPVGSAARVDIPNKNLLGLLRRDFLQG